MSVETGGECDVRGKSGEVGCLQFLPSTWKMYSTNVLGYVAPMTKVNELYVASVMIQSWLYEGLTDEQVAVRWNSGGIRHKKGVNKYGVAYDTYAYAKKVLSKI
jgi:hypothetical protein